MASLIAYSSYVSLAYSVTMVEDGVDQHGGLPLPLTETPFTKVLSKNNMYRMALPHKEKCFRDCWSRRYIKIELWTDGLLLR